MRHRALTFENVAEDIRKYGAFYVIESAPDRYGYSLVGMGQFLEQHKGKWEHIADAHRARHWRAGSPNVRGSNAAGERLRR
jgi:hypothetical protein